MPQLRKEQIAGMNVHYKLYPLEYFMKAQQELGMKSIEFWAAGPHFFMNADEVQSCDNVKQLAEDCGLKIVAFTPESYEYQYMLSTANEELRQISMNFYVNAIKSAQALGVSIMPVSCAGGQVGQEPQAIIDRTVKSLNYLAPIAADHGVTLAVESLPMGSTIGMTTLKEIQEVLGTVAHSNVKAAMDVCAVRCAKETMQQWFDALGKDIVHIHFTDGRPAGHLVWGQGLHPLDDYIQVLNDNHYEGYLGQKLNIRGMWFDPKFVDDVHGFIGTDFIPENYTFNPKVVDEKNMAALAPYLVD